MVSEEETTEEEVVAEAPEFTEIDIADDVQLVEGENYRRFQGKGKNNLSCD